MKSIFISLDGTRNGVTGRRKQSLPYSWYNALGAETFASSKKNIPR